MKYIIMATIKSDTSENRIFRTFGPFENYNAANNRVEELKTIMLKLGFVPFRSDGRGDFDFVPKIIDEI